MHYWQQTVSPSALGYSDKKHVTQVIMHGITQRFPPFQSDNLLIAWQRLRDIQLTEDANELDTPDQIIRENHFKRKLIVPNK